MPAILGILNITEDSFSDGAKYLEQEVALAHARMLIAGGADVLDIGAASSKPDAMPVAGNIETSRLAPIVAAMKESGVAISIDTFAPEVQRWAVGRGVDYINDVRGFPDAGLYPALAESSAKLIVMHSVEGMGPATRVHVPAETLMDRILGFFEERVAALETAGIARERIILDPGMGLFLGTDRDASFAVLRGLPALKRAFGLPVLVSVSRKSFLRRLTGRDVTEAGAVSLAAELFALLQGADYIRTHEPKPLKDALAVWSALGLETDRNQA